MTADTVTTEPKRRGRRSQAVAVAPSTEAAPGNMLALLDRAIKSPDIDVSKMRELFTFQKELMAHQAEIDFNEAKHRILADLASIKIYKTKSVLYDVDKRDKAKGQAEAFKYAPLEAIDEIMRPLLAREEMDVSYTTEPRPGEGGGAVVALKLKHKHGYFETHAVPLPLDASGGKSNIQAMGSTVSYGRRYALCMAFNIVVLDEDDDGMGGFIDDVQIKNIRDLLGRIRAKDKSKGDEARFCEYLHVPTLEELPHRSYPKATSALEEALGKLGVTY